MNDDDVYPNEGSNFVVPVEPAEQTAARKKEKAETLQALPVIKSIIQHFEERIAYRDTLDSIKISPTQSSELHLRACVTNDMLKMALKEEKEMLEELLEVHIKQR